VHWGDQNLKFSVVFKSAVKRKKKRKNGNFHTKSVFEKILEISATLNKLPYIHDIFTIWQRKLFIPQQKNLKTTYTTTVFYCYLKFTVG